MGSTQEISPISGVEREVQELRKDFFGVLNASAGALSIILATTTISVTEGWVLHVALSLFFIGMLYQYFRKTYFRSYAERRLAEKNIAFAWKPASERGENDVEVSTPDPLREFWSTPLFSVGVISFIPCILFKAISSSGMLSDGGVLTVEISQAILALFSSLLVLGLLYGVVRLFISEPEGDSGSGEKLYALVKAA